jgi:hypothetical protein
MWLASPVIALKVLLQWVQGMLPSWCTTSFFLPDSVFPLKYFLLPHGSLHRYEQMISSRFCLVPQTPTCQDQYQKLLKKFKYVFEAFLGTTLGLFVLFYLTIKEKNFRKPMVWHPNYMTRPSTHVLYILFSRHTSYINFSLFPKSDFKPRIASWYPVIQPGLSTPHWRLAVINLQHSFSLAL